MAFTIQMQKENANSVLVLAGRLVGRGNKELEDALKTLDIDTMPRRAVDLTGVEFFDSYALGQVLFYCNSMKKKGVKICLVNKNRNEQLYINRLIKISELNQIIPVVNNLEETSTVDTVPGS